VFSEVYIMRQEESMDEQQNWGWEGQSGDRASKEGQDRFPTVKLEAGKSFILGNQSAHCCKHLPSLNSLLRPTKTRLAKSTSLGLGPAAPQTSCRSSASLHASALGFGLWAQMTEHSVSAHHLWGRAPVYCISLFGPCCEKVWEH
jgi:hypothetical protein